MILGFDSSFTLPDDAGLRQAKAGGVGVWFGYLATKGGVNLGHAWPKSNFDRIRAAGMATGAYVSGLDDPAALKALAAAWGIRIILDVENGIRGDGWWVQNFLDVSGAGLYGNPPVIPGRRAACYVEAAYPGGPSPRSTWFGPLPNGPRGWQSQGSHSAYGATVDSGYYDDWFAGGASASQPLQPQGEIEMKVVQTAGVPEVWVTNSQTKRQLSPGAEVAEWLGLTAQAAPQAVGPAFLNGLPTVERGTTSDPAKYDYPQVSIPGPQGVPAGPAAATPGSVDPNIKLILDAATRIETALKGA